MNDKKKKKKKKDKRKAPFTERDFYEALKAASKPDDKKDKKKDG